MAQKFERHFATGIAETQRLPRADVRSLADVGQGLEAQAFQQAGEALTDVSAILFKWHEREGNSEYDTLRGLYHSRVGEFERTSFADSTELEVGKKRLEEDIGNLPSINGLKNKSGLRKYKEFTDLKKENRTKLSAEKEIRMIERNGQIALFKGLTNVAQITDETIAMQEIDTLIAGGLDDGSIKTGAQAITLKDRFTDDWILADLNRRSQAVIRADGEVDWTAAVDWLNQAENTKDVDADILEDLREEANTQKALQNNRDAGQLEFTQEQQRGEIYGLIESNDSGASGAIDISDLDEKEKAQLRKLARNPDIALNYPEYDKVVTIIDGVASGKNTVKQAKDAIAGGVGKHYDATEAKALRSKLSTNSKDGSPTRTPAHTRGITAIEEIMDLQIKSQEFGPEDVIEEGKLLQKKNRLKNDLDSWATKKPRTDEEIEKKIKSLTRIPTEEVTLGFFEKLLSPKKEGFFSKFLRTESEELIQERLQALAKNESFKQLTGNEQDRVRELVKSGFTQEAAFRRVESIERLSDKEQKRREELRRKAGLP